jgi:hypothetical protein
MPAKQRRSSPIPIPPQPASHAECKTEEHEDDNVGSPLSDSEAPPISPMYAQSFYISIASHEKEPNSPQDIISSLIDNDGGLWNMVNDERHEAYKALCDVLADTIKTINKAVLPLAELILCEEWCALIALEMQGKSNQNFTRADWVKKVNVAMLGIKEKLNNSMQSVFDLVRKVLPFQVHYYTSSAQVAGQGIPDDALEVKEEMGSKDALPTVGNASSTATLQSNANDDTEESADAPPSSAAATPVNVLGAGGIGVVRPASPTNETDGDDIELASIASDDSEAEVNQSLTPPTAAGVAKSVEPSLPKKSVHFTHEDGQLDPKLVADIKEQVLNLHRIQTLLEQIESGLIKMSADWLARYDQYGSHTCKSMLEETMGEISDKNDIVQDLYISTVSERFEPHVNYIKIIKSGVEVFLADEKIAGGASLPRKIYYLPLDKAGGTILQYVYYRHKGNGERDEAAGDNANAGTVNLSSAERALISKAPMELLLKPIEEKSEEKFANFLMFAISAPDPEIGKVTMERFATEVEVMDGLKPTSDDVPDTATWAEQKALLLEGLALLKEAKNNVSGYYEDKLYRRRRGKLTWDELRFFYADRIPQRGEEAAKMMLALVTALEHLDVGDVAQEVREITDEAGFTFGVSGSELHSSMQAWCKKAREMCTKKYNDALRKYHERRAQHERNQENAERDKEIEDLKKAHEQDRTERERERQEQDAKIEEQATKLNAQGEQIAWLMEAVGQLRPTKISKEASEEKSHIEQAQLSSSESSTSVRPADTAALTVTSPESPSQSGRLSPAEVVGATLLGRRSGSADNDSDAEAEAVAARPAQSSRAILGRGRSYSA